MIGEYEIGRIVGSGMIGIAMLARHHISKNLVCLKTMEMKKIADKNLFENIRIEIEIQIELSCEQYIMPLFEIIRRDKEIIMVFPYLPGRDLFRFLKSKKNKRLSEYEA